MPQAAKRVVGVLWHFCVVGRSVDVRQPALWVWAREEPSMARSFFDFGESWHVYVVLQTILASWQTNLHRKPVIATLLSLTSPPAGQAANLRKLVYAAGVTHLLKWSSCLVIRHHAELHVRLEKTWRLTNPRGGLVTTAGAICAPRQS